MAADTVATPAVGALAFIDRMVLGLLWPVLFPGSHGLPATRAQDGPL